MSKLIAKLIFGLIRPIFTDKTNLVLENLALRFSISSCLPLNPLTNSPSPTPISPRLLCQNWYHCIEYSDSLDRHSILWTISPMA
jgi:hypothetical protein